MTQICTAIGFFVFSCVSSDPVPTAARYCQLAKLVRYSSHDTAETRKQLRSANAAYRAACDAEASPAPGRSLSPVAAK